MRFVKTGFFAMLMLLLFSLSVHAADNTRIPYAVRGGNIYFNAYFGEVVDSDETVTAADIPAKINGVAVTGIGDMAFFRCSSLTSVVIPNSVTSIGKGAFSSCWSLTSVTIPNSVTSIGKGAFSSCWSLTSVTIPNSVTSIGEEAFYICSKLTSVTIGNGVTSIGECAFWECSKLTSIAVSEGNSNYCAENGVLFNKDKTRVVQYPEGKVGAYQIPDGVTSIGDRAFWNCGKLKSVTIPNSVTSIGDSAFCYCNGLTSVTISDSVTSIGDGAFCFCWRLTSVMIGNGVTSIGDCAFYECNALTNVTIGNSVTSIGKSAFKGCSSLTSLVLQNGVTSIEDWAFDDCDNLTSVTLPSSVTSIGKEAFFGYGKLEIYYGGTQAQWQTITNGRSFWLARIYYNCAGSVGETINWRYNPSLRQVSITDPVPATEKLFAVGYNSAGRMVFLKQVTEPDAVTFGDDTARVKLIYCDANFVPKCLNATIDF